MDVIELLGDICNIISKDEGYPVVPVVITVNGVDLLVTVERYLGED